MAARTLRYWITNARLLSAVLGLAIALSATAALAQQKVDPSQASKLSQVKQILRDDVKDAASRKVVDDYLNKFFLLQFTTPTSKYFTLDDLPKVRRELKILQATAKGDSLNYLNDAVFKKMKVILGGGPYGEHETAIKYNAMLVIADLNQPAAFSLMLAVLQSPKQPDYFKTAALLGLQRMATAGQVPKEKTADLTKVLLEILSQETPAGRSASVQNFLRRRAGQALAALGNPGPNNSVVKAMEAIAADPKARPLQRSEMAQFLGEIKYPPTAKADVQRLSNVLGHQTVEICKHELERAQAENRAPSQRLLLYSVYSAGVGLKGLAAAADGDADTKEKVGKLKSKIAALYTDLNDPALKADGVTDKVEKRLPEIEELLPEKPATSEPLAAAGKEAPVKPAGK